MVPTRKIVFTLTVMAIVCFASVISCAWAQDTTATTVASQTPGKMYTAGDRFDLKGPSAADAGIPDGWQADYTWTIEEINDGKYIDVTLDTGVADPKAKDISGNAYWPKGTSADSVDYRVTLAIYPKTTGNSLGACIASTYFYFQVKKPDCSKITITPSEVCETDVSKLAYSGSVNGLTLAWYLNPGNKPQEGVAAGHPGIKIGEGASIDTHAWMSYEGYKNGKNIIALRANDGVVCTREFTIAKVPKAAIST